MAAAKKKQVVKTVKKKWYGIYSTGHFDNVKIGETLLDDPQKIVGKPVKVNLMSLTNNIRQQQVLLHYSVDKLEGDKGLASWKGLELNSGFLKRIVRRRTTRIDDSLVLKTSDDKLVRVKPMIITRHNISTTLKSEIRKAAIKFLVERIGGMDYNSILSNTINLSIQKDLRNSLTKFCPIKTVEIRVVEALKEGNPLTLEALRGEKKSTKQITKISKKARKQPSEEEDDGYDLPEESDETDDHEEKPKKAAPKAEETKDESEEESEKDENEEAEESEDSAKKE